MIKSIVQFVFISINLLFLLSCSKGPEDLSADELAIFTLPAVLTGEDKVILGVDPGPIVNKLGLRKTSSGIVPDFSGQTWYVGDIYTKSGLYCWLWIIETSSIVSYCTISIESENDEKKYLDQLLQEIESHYKITFIFEQLTGSTYTCTKRLAKNLEIDIRKVVNDKSITSLTFSYSVLR